MAKFDFAQQVMSDTEEEKFDFSGSVKQSEKEAKKSNENLPLPGLATGPDVNEMLGITEDSTKEEVQRAVESYRRAKQQAPFAGMHRGMQDRFEGIMQLGLEATNLFKTLTFQKKFGTPDEATEEFTREAMEGRREFEESLVGQMPEAKVTRVQGNIAPFLAIPGQPNTPFKIALYSTGIGAAEGVTRFASPLESRTANAISGAQWGLVGGLSVLGLAKVINLVRGSPGMVHQSDEIKKLMDEVKKAEKAGLKLEPLSIDQAAPENMILGRIGAQAESTSKFAQMQRSSQRAGVLEGARQAKDVDVTRYKAGKVILSEADKAYKAEYNRLLNQIPRVTPRKAGRTLKGATQDFVEKSRRHVSNLYSRVDEAAAAEKPVYDLTYAKETSSDIRRLVLGETEPLARQAGAPINIAPTPEGKLRVLLDDIDRLSGQQTSYEAVKTLRSRAGELIETWPWEASTNKGQAKRLYKVLSEIMNNPLNRAPKTVAAHKEASAAARARYEALDAPAIRKILQSDNPFQISKNFGEIGGLTDDIMREINKWSQQKAEIFKQYVRNNNILMSGDSALDNIRNWRLKDPEGFRFVVPKNKEAKLLSLATKIDELRNSNIGALVNAQAKAKDAVKLLVGKENVSQADVDHIITSFGGRGSRGHDALRAGIYEDIINQAEETGKYGVKTLNKDKLNSVINQYEEAGVLNILTKDDRAKIRGLRSYMNLLMARGKDPGTSLEAAQIITNLKHPSSFIAGVHQLTVNSVMARMLMSQRLSKIVLGSGKEKWLAPGNVAEKNGVILNALLDDYGEAAKEVQH